MDKTISILGCGWYGLPLAKRLISSQYAVKGSTTNQEKITILKEAGIEPYVVSFESEIANFDPEFFHSKILIISIPPGRNTGNQETYPDKIKSIAEAAGRTDIAHVIFISSTSVYGDNNEQVTESTAPAPQTPSGKAILAAENILLNQTNFKTTIIRFAGLIGPGRDPARFFGGKTDIPNGLAPVNLIHLNDCLELTVAVIEQKAYNIIINAVTPDHPSKQVFYKKSAVRSGLPLPIFTDELTTWKTVATNQIPSALKYDYKISSWIKWLNEDKL